MTDSSHILVVDDHRDIRELLGRQLRLHEYRVTGVRLTSAGVVDLPPEEDAELCLPAQAAGLSYFDLTEDIATTAKVKKIAAHVLEAGEDDIVIEGGAVKVAGTDKQMLWHEVGLAAYTAHNIPEGMEPGLKESAFYDPTNFTFPAGCYICEVEVDPETGVTEVVQFVASDDFGTIINPMIVEGQVHGGIAQGIGQAMLENVVYDASGQQLSASYMDYAMPRADDLPNYSVHHASTTCPGNPLGMKGCGEAGAIGSPPAVINAITDAIGNNNLSMPATPAAVWAALQDVSQKLAAE